MRTPSSLSNGAPICLIYHNSSARNGSFTNPDVVLLAESFGAKGYRIQRAEELLPTLQRALADDTVSIIACPVDSSENMRLTNKLGKLTESI
jgi:acetolactate synthase I/II/III large subunit